MRGNVRRKRVQAVLRAVIASIRPHLWRGYVWKKHPRGHCERRAAGPSEAISVYIFNATSEVASLGSATLGPEALRSY
ncbi:MAG: hypothetical protein C4532_19380 [Candidatus Abyssobacteria bacterium SURF_17]|uniref:Uncharacterized protein n=1 Tax=Candidatus Abyssobacteria bacterium SURF_17 TaxID=2093361 RepID=A0A419ENK0_9BACT|nr:MAG: hypothetical protein C4532_19380 [Candidatus Abyssubacteria bacterium SURF_17]